jgi:FkbM family methyltransferase
VKVTLKNKAGNAQVIVRNPNEHMQKYWKAGRFYEDGMLAWIFRHYSGGIFVDAGSSIGNHTLFFAKFCNPDQVISIEPLRESLAHQLEILKLNKVIDKVKYHRCALSDQHGRCKMEPFAPPGHISVGMYQVQFEDDGDTNVTTLDSFALHKQDHPVTLVKIDVEHHQMEMLRGSITLLTKCQPALFVECPTDEEFEEVKAFLEPLGYVMRSKHNATPTYEFIVPQESPLKILSLSRHDFAGTSYFLSDALNRHSPHDCRAAVMQRNKLGFPVDVTKPPRKQLINLWKWANVVHLHDEMSKVVQGLPSKPTVQTFHGSQFRKRPGHHSGIATGKGWLLTVATPDLVRPTSWHTDGPPWLPDTRPDLSEYVNPADDFLAVHAPTHRKRKGTDTIIAACKKAGIRLDLIEKTQWEACLRRKGRGWILIDQLTFGYGCNAIEAWSMGQPVLSGGNDNSLRAISKQCGAELPFYHITADVDVIAEALVQMKEDQALYKQYMRLGQQHYQRFHSPESVARRAGKFYHTIYRRFGQRAWNKQRKRLPRKIPQYAAPDAAKEAGLVLIRYVGGLIGKTNWFPEGGTNQRYVFSSKQPVRYVHQADASWFLTRKRRKKLLFKRVEDGD